MNARYFWQSNNGVPWVQGEFVNGVATGGLTDVSTIPYSAGLADDTLKARDTRFVRTRLATNSSSSSLFIGRFSGAVVPAGATITGVKLVLTRSSSREGLRDISMQLVIAGVASVASERFGPSGSSYWPVSETNSKIGGPGDMWGLTSAELRPDAVMSSGFGVVITTKNFHQRNSTDGLIGEASVYFTYTISAAALMDDDQMIMESDDNNAVALPETAMGSIVAAVAVVVVAVAVVAVVVTRRRLAKKQKTTNVLMTSGEDNVCIAVNPDNDLVLTSVNPLYQAHE